MNVNRQYILLGALGLMAAVYFGESIVTEAIQAPLQALDDEKESLEEDIEKQRKLIRETRAAKEKIDRWNKRSLPSDTETARSLYRNWLLEIVRASKLRSATVDSGSPARRFGLYRAMPFTVQARGTLREITDALFAFSQSGQLHKVISLRLSPVGESGQFNVVMSVEAVMLPGIKRSTLGQGESQTLASTHRPDYDVIARDNIFGIGISKLDPMKETVLSAVTWRNGVPQAWITERIGDRVHKLEPGADFDTTALRGRIVTVDDDSVVIESGEEQLTMTIGQSFAEARQATPAPAPSAVDGVN